MTIRVEKESSDHRIYSIDVAFQRLRQLVLALQNVDEIVISICDLHTKRELTESIVLSLSLLSSDAGTKGVVDLIPHKQQYNTPVTASSSTVAVATAVADASFGKDTNDNNSKALASPISAESTITDDNDNHKDTEAHDRELSNSGSRVHADAPVRVHDPLSVLYSLFDHTCGLYFGVDTMLSQIESTSRLRRRDLANQSSQGIPDTVNTGNGELTRGSMTKVFDYLMLHAPTELRLTSDSSFLDLGSGFGKSVLHAVVQAQVKRSFGIEWVPKRCQLAQMVLDALRSGQKDGFTGDLSWASDWQWDEIEFVQGDVSEAKHEAMVRSATHVYMFDKLFREETKQRLLSWLNESDTLQVLACYTTPSQLRSFGDTTFDLVHQLGSLRSTGNEQFTCYFYRKQHGEVLRIDSNPRASPRRSGRVARSAVSSLKHGRSRSFDQDSDSEWSLPNSKKNDMQLSDLVNRLESAYELLAADQTANEVTLDFASMQSAAEAASSAAGSVYQCEDLDGVRQANQRLERLMSEADGLKMVGYYFRSLLAQALYEECKRNKRRNYGKLAAEVLGVSHADCTALPQFAACIQRHAGGRDRCTVSRLLAMPLIRADIPWRQWRDRLLVGKGKLVDEAMRILSSKR